MGAEPGRGDYRDALAACDLLAALRDFDPHVVGTPPLGLDVPGSDVDVLCHAPRPERLAALLWRRYGQAPGFRMWQWAGPPRPLVASFYVVGWVVEIFGDARPVREQAGYRHFDVERRLLGLGGPPLRAAVLRSRRAGAKTEPAFAAALGLPGDPHAALFALADASDDGLRRVLRAAGFEG
jgi:hypothetical protein